MKGKSGWLCKPSSLVRPAMGVATLWLVVSGAAAQGQDSSTLLKAKAEQAGIVRTPQEQRNIEVVHGFWRDIWEARRVELAPKYMAEGYIEHNPNGLGNGREVFMKAFSRLPPPAPDQPRVKATDMLTFTHGDLVILVQEREGPDPANPGNTYKYNWLEIFRVENGLLQEHWDSSTRIVRPPL